MSLKQKTISGLVWSFVENISYQAVSFIIGVVLARLLSPKEFGLIGMTAIFMAVSQTFVDSGFGQALIRKNDCSQKDYSTVFFFNLVAGLFCYGVLFAAAGPIGIFFKEPKLPWLIRVLSLNIIIGSLSAIQGTILVKNVDFKRKTIISVTSAIISGGLGITLAYQGWGVWSLAWQIVCQSLVSSVILWATSRWRPVLLFDYAAFKEMFHFGSKLLVSSLIDTIYRNIYYLVIGKYFSAAELGYYTRADGFKKIPSENLSGIVGRVGYPVLVTMKDDDVRLKEGYKKLIKSSMLISFVLMIGMAASARSMVLFLIGEKWLPAVIYLQMLCFVGMLYPIHALNLDMVNVKGRSDLFLRLEIIKKLLAIPIIIIGIIFGMKIMIIGMMVNSVIAYYLNSYWSGKMVSYPIKEQIKDIMPSLVLALVMGSAVFVIGSILTLKPSVIFGIQVLTGAGLTIGLARLFKLDAYLEIQEIVNERWVKRFKVKN